VKFTVIAGSFNTLYQYLPEQVDKMCKDAEKLTPPVKSI
jgi:hypothetical protein